MNRQKIVDAILKLYREHDNAYQVRLVEHALKRITSDTTLIAFAIDLGIDTDAVLSGTVNS